MSLLGQAAVAMWWHVLPEQRVEFGDWHSHEHLPERMGIPGFKRGSRWTSTSKAGDFFIIYELESYETLTSKGYLDRLNAPTPWSSKMMPHHLGMIRSQCRIAASFGGGIATAMATIRLSPAPGMEQRLQAAIVDRLRELVVKPGLTGGHLLVTDTPRTASPTTEQRRRGGGLDRSPVRVRCRRGRTGDRRPALGVEPWQRRRERERRHGPVPARLHDVAAGSGGMRS